MDNLMLAWGKLEGEVSHQDDWCDMMEFYAYKFQLKDKLVDLHKRLVSGTYQMQPIRPLPFPKGPAVIRTKGKDDAGNEIEIEDTELRVRQYFHVSIEDQLVWIAYCNVIAQFVERRMPGWSFGNRTDVRVWYKDKDGRRELQVGNYRNTRNSIYKRWNHTWPRYRKLLSLTIKLMCKDGNTKRKVAELTEEEQQMLRDNEQYPEQKLYYLEDKYFDKFDGDQLYWAGIDIERFYPNIDRKLIKENLEEIIYDIRLTPEFLELTNTLLDFKIDVTGFKEEELAAMDLSSDGTYEKGLPTGLLMAGFLSNLALLGIDDQVRRWLAGNHKIAHFRYVDDHVVLSQDKHALVEWVRKYIDLLSKYGFTINVDKTEPESLSCILKDKEKPEDELKGLDPAYPTPLMTLTLQKVSQMADLNVEQLSNTEIDMVFADLQELLIMDISDQEIKKETRISFAVTMLSRILVHGDVDYEELGRLKQELRKELEIQDLLKKKEWLEWFYRDDEYPNMPSVGEKLKGKMTSAEAKCQQINSLLQSAAKNRDRKYLYILNLIEKALEDVPERTRIWIRMIQYCYKHKPESIVEAFTLLEGESIREKLHSLDIAYLRMLLFNKLAQLIMRDLPRKEHRDRYEKAILYLKTILDTLREETGEEMYFEKETYLFVNHVLDLAQLINNQAQISIDTETLYFGDYVDADFWILYYLYHINDKDKEKKEQVIQTVHDSITTDSQYYPALFMKCMSSPLFQKDAIENIQQDDGLTKYIKNHHLEVDVYRTFGKRYRRTIASFFELDNIEKATEGYITLSEWIFALSEHTSLLQTEYLEYIALKVIRSVIKKMDECHNDLFFTFQKRYINLFNLCIKKECLEKIGEYDYWDEADELVTYETTVYPISNYPFDFKLFPNEYCDVYDIGVILLQMLTLDHLPSDYLVDAAYGYKWENTIRSLMQQGYMSFYTNMILMACLSKRNRESMFFVKSGKDDIRPDDDLDPPIISNLQEMLEHVEHSLRLLKGNRISLPDHKYRTLSVVSLDNYKAFEKKVRASVETEDEVLKDYLKVDIIQTNMDARQAWSGLKAKGYEITESEMQKCWLEIVLYFKQIMDMDEEVRPQLVILPEFAFDKDYYTQLKTLSDKSGCLVIAGRNFVEVPGKRIMNKGAVMVPFKWPNGHGNTSTPDFEFGKYFFAKIEEDFIKKIGFKKQPYDKMYLVDAGQYGKMGLAICADFYDIERFTIYRGRIQHLFIIAYNKDVKSFYYLAEAISRIVFCNVVICNTGFYGGSIAFAPYKDDYKRYVYKHEGGNLYTNQIVLLPVASLFKAQIGKDNDKFKSCPPGYEYKGIGITVEKVTEQ